jgi:hypothetical protein
MLGIFNCTALHLAMKSCRSHVNPSITDWHVAAMMVLTAAVLLIPSVLAFAVVSTPTVSWPRRYPVHPCILPYSGPIGRCSVMVRSISLYSSEDIDASLGLVDRFDRWRFLQKLLDEEVDPSDLVSILLAVLQTFLNDPNSTDDAEESSSPVLTKDLRATIESVLEDATAHAILRLLSPETEVPAHLDLESPAEILARLEQLLPDPIDKEDASKGLWDTVIELHGRESVKINERNGTTSWKASCMIARILLYYDFLTKGLQR